MASDRSIAGEAAAERRDEVGIVLLSDVRASRELENRAAFARRLDEVLAAINEREGVTGAFEHQAGLDEFAGVLRPGRAGAVLARLWTALHPIAVRFALVQGVLDVIPEPSEEGEVPGASGFDGPAFHAASTELEALRSGTDLVRIRIGEGERTDRLLTSLANLSYGDMLDWTDRQMEVASTYRRAGSQRAAAEELGVEQSTVSRSLTAASYYRIEEARATCIEALDEWSRERAGAPDSPDRGPDQSG